MSDNTIYDYDFSVHETEPKRADMLNALKARVKALDKGTIISSTDYNDDSQYDEERALSAYLLFKLFPTKVHLLKNHYTKEEVDSLLSDLISKYYLKNEIDDMLNALKNELKAKMLADGNDLKQALNALKTELSKHRTQEIIDHPDNSITESKIRDKNISKSKLNDALQAEINGKVNKSGDDINGRIHMNKSDIKFSTYNKDGTEQFAYIGFGGMVDNRQNFDVGSIHCRQTNLNSELNPGWYNGQWQRFLIQNDLDNINSQIRDINAKLNKTDNNRGSMYKMDLEYVSGSNLRAEYLGYRNNGYIYNLYLCRIPNGFSAIYYHTQSQHKYWTGGSDDSHQETSYQTNVNILLKDEILRENNVSELGVSSSSNGISINIRNSLDRSFFIKNDYFCLRIKSGHSLNFNNNLINIGNYNFNLGIYIIS